VNRQANRAFARRPGTRGWEEVPRADDVGEVEERAEERSPPRIRVPTDQRGHEVVPSAQMTLLRDIGATAETPNQSPRQAE